MNGKILLAYATKYGATKEIAEKIGDVLRQAGLQIDLMPVGQVSDPLPYEAIILGSAVYIGKWRKDAVRFLEAHQQALAGRPVWLFSSGPTGDGDPLELMKGWRFPSAQQPIVDRIRPRDVALFHGHLDMDKLNFIEKGILKNVKAPIGDFRDWDAIAAWATSIADLLKQAS
jgi:menaquinone-dependent protoporphyrinogen oxidase